MKTTSSTQSTVLVAEIPGILADPARGAISLVGDHGGLSLITGPAEDSGLVMGTLSIETEHGVVYLEPEEQTEISEEVPYSEDHQWEVSWGIDSTGSSPEKAAAKIWRDVFGRTETNPDDACIFTVRDVATGEFVEVDLNSAGTVTVKIENGYVDGHKSDKTVTVEPPEAFDEATLDDWWNNVVFPHTGDGHSEGMRSSAEAKVLEGPQGLVGETYGWDG